MELVYVQISRGPIVLSKAALIKRYVINILLLHLHSEHVSIYHSHIQVTPAE